MRTRSLITIGMLLVALVTRVESQPVAEEYRIGPEDILTVSVWDNRDLDQVVFVRPDGKISLPLVGQVDASGLTVAQLTANLTDMYSETVKGARVTVGVREIRSRTIFFVGGVARPGPLQLTQDLTFLQAVAVAGGPAAGADLESAFVVRRDQIIPVDYTAMVAKRDTSGNIRLQPGDTIVVPLASVVYIQGEVRNPGMVRFSGDLTVLKALAQAGGFTPLAAPRRITLLRGDFTKKEKMELDAFEMIREPNGAPDVPLKPNDMVIVPQRLPGVLPGG